MKICKIDGCGKPLKARGLCHAHYAQARRRGDPMAPKLPPGRPGLGRRNHPLYGAWAGMINRCHNPNNSSYAGYGAKGVFVCDRWRADFLNFLADMGDRPEGKTLDRIDPAGPYAPENCRWATTTEQRRNISADGDRRMREAMATGTKRRWANWRNEGSPPLPPRASKLTPEQVEQIRTMLANDISQREISERFGVHYATINDISKGKTWRFSPDYLRRAASALEG